MNRIEHPIVPYVAGHTPSTHEITEPPPPTDGGPVEAIRSVLARRWRLIVATVVATVAATVAYCMLVEPRYTAEATLLIEPRGPQVLPAHVFGGSDDPFASTKYDYYLTQFRLLRSPTLARRVISELKLDQDPRFLAPLEGVPAEVNRSAAVSEAVLTGKYLDQLSVVPVRATRLVQIVFESSDPQLAAQIANAHARAFVRLDLEREWSGLEQLRRFLEAKLQTLSTKMEAAEAELINYQSAHSLLPIDLRGDVAGERLMDLSRRLTQAEAERIVVEGEYRLVQSGDETNVPTVLGNPLVQKLREDYNRLELEHALLAAKWRPSYPELRRVRQQLERAKTLLDAEIGKAVESVKARYLAATNTVERLTQELAAQRLALIGREDEQGKLLTLARDAETTRTLYNNLLTHVKELDIAGGANISNISLADPAVAPRRPTSPRTRFNVALSLVTGLLLGIGLAFLRDASDRTIRDVHDIRRVSGLGTLAVVPDLNLRSQAKKTQTVKPLVVNGNGAVNGNGNGIKRTRLILGPRIGCPSAEAYRTLRTSLLLKRTPTSPRIILVTSASGTEGKTTTAVNTAAALASCGGSVLLVDGDLRLPRCHDALGVPLTPGLAEYLMGRLTTQPIQKTSIENLSFVPAGKATRNPAELLTSLRMWLLLRSVRDRFDFVVIDSPPILAVSDASLLANIADGVVLVVEHRRSREEHVHAAMVRLREAGAVVLGAVLNRGTVGSEYYEYGWPSGDFTADANPETPRVADEPVTAEPV